MDKIKEAFEKWIANETYTKDEIIFRHENPFWETHAAAFHGGYTSRDAEIEQLKADLKFATDRLRSLEIEHYATRYQSKG